MSVEGLLITLPSKSYSVISFREYKLSLLRTVGIPALAWSWQIASPARTYKDCKSYSYLLCTLLLLGAGVVLIEGLGCSLCRRAMFSSR